MRKMFLLLFILVNITMIFARYYNPDIGRFISADPVTQDGGADLEGLNRYSYCSNNPIKYIDPTGNEEKLPKLVVPFRFTFAGDFANYDQESKSFYLKGITENLKQVISIMPPLKYTPSVQDLRPCDGLYSNTPPCSPHNLTEIIMYLTSSNSIFDPIGNPKAGYGATNASYYFPDSIENKINIRLFLDNIYLDTTTGNLKSSAAIKAATMTAIAHELYGNAQYFLGISTSIDELVMNGMTIMTRLENEINSHQVGIDFIGRYLKSSNFKSLPKIFRDSLSTEFMKLRKEQETNKQSWEKLKLKYEEKQRIQDSIRDANDDFDYDR